MPRAPWLRRSPTLDRKNMAALQHFLHFSLGRAGRGFDVPPEDAYPVPWPDFTMHARPALPPAHPNWEQEKRNLIAWFALLWQWQGGNSKPDWDKMVWDVGNGLFERIDMKRLPQPLLLDSPPEKWGEATTLAWSKHIRSTMDKWGRVLRSKGDTAFQFRKIKDVLEGEQPIVHDNF
ncbi:hypothetical protein FRC08_018443, partial [Ceratobasidium sp. 394]